MKIKLHYKSISEVVGVDDVGLITLLDELEQRQLNIVCDKFIDREQHVAARGFTFLASARARAAI